LFLFSSLCIQTSVTIYDPMWSPPAEAISHVRVYSVLLLYLFLINICWILIYFGKRVFFFTEFITFCCYVSPSITTTVLLLCISVHYNYSSVAMYLCPLQLQFHIYLTLFLLIIFYLFSVNLFYYM
jgi:hypothetical protein